MKREAVNDKILIIGIDGMDPRATRRYLREGKMPNVKKLLEAGCANKDLEMLGGHPTGTPPMWTTLATGCNSNVHGITDFTLPCDEGLEYTSYGFDSRQCRAEQLWNVFAEAGKKTLVWHWPGSSWPPTSDNPNLHVVDGSQPGGVNLGVGIVAGQFYAVAGKDIETLTYKKPGQELGVAPCAINDLETSEGNAADGMMSAANKSIVLSADEGTDGFIKYPNNHYSQSPLKPAEGWENAPEGALEFTILMSGGLLRRPALFVKNEDGIYDSVQVFTSKKAPEPLAVLPLRKIVHDIADVDYSGNEKFEVTKSMILLEAAEDGSSLRMFISAAVNRNEDSMFYPKRLYRDVVENVGYPEDAPMLVVENGYGSEMYDIMLTLWDRYCDWQAEALNYLIDAEEYNVIFSHNHVVDAQMHAIARNMVHRDYSPYSAETARDYMEKVYIQTDNYIGKFLHYIDEGWTVFLISDHALVCSKHDHPFICEGSGVTAGGMMRELGLTVVQQDENGNDIPEIDWTKTICINTRSNQIYLNLKGRTDHGIIDPEDQWEVEEDIITKLYGYKHPVTGKRVIGLALRNKDAVILGAGGDRCGDILIWTADDYSGDHFDSITTCYGENETSLQPIFIAAGVGIKKGEVTNRIIRQIDFAPTVAVIGGVRMPADCEGAPVYQILTEQY